MTRAIDEQNTLVLHVAAIFVLLLYLAPYLLLGEDTRVLIHDNLDGTAANLKVLAESNHLFSPNGTPIETLFNGIPREALGSEFSVLVWLFALLPTYAAYVVNQVLIHLLAYIGMYRLLSNHFMPETAKLITVGTALSFALLPHYPLAGLSVAGLPLAMDAILTIRNGKATGLEWVILILTPLYSSLVLSFFALIALVATLWLLDLLIKRQPNIRFLAAIFLISFVFLVVEYRQILSLFLDESYVSHRVAFKRVGLQDTLYGALKSEGLRNFASGHYHAPSLHGALVLPSAIVALVILLANRSRDWRLVKLVALIAMISAFYGIWSSWSALVALRLDFLFNVNLGRFYWLSPMLWYVVFSLSLLLIRENLTRGRYLVYAVLLVQITYLFTQHDHFVLRKELRAYSDPYPTYGEFYSSNLFREIETFINRPKSEYRVVSVGMHPSIALYNGFYTLDGYVSNYPLAYKQKFRRIIAPELEASMRLQRYFDDWGSRVYIFDDDLDGFMNVKDEDVHIANLQIDVKEFQDMGGKYVFSAVVIENATELGLDLLGVFERDNAAWRIHLYSVEPRASALRTMAGLP